MNGGSPSPSLGDDEVLALYQRVLEPMVSGAHTSRIDYVEFQEIKECLPSKVLASEYGRFLDQVIEEGWPPDRYSGEEVCFLLIDLAFRQRLCQLADECQVEATPVLEFAGLVRLGRNVSDFAALARAAIEEMRAALVTLKESARSDSVLECRGLVLDIEHRTVVMDGVTYPLTDQQVEILACLIRAKGGWVCPNELKQLPSLPTRPDRAIKKLPACIRGLIESKAGTGRRLPVE